MILCLVAGSHALADMCARDRGWTVATRDRCLNRYRTGDGRAASLALTAAHLAHFEPAETTVVRGYGYLKREFSDALDAGSYFVIGDTAIADKKGQDSDDNDDDDYKNDRRNPERRSSRTPKSRMGGSTRGGKVRR
jgi:hypothetical protein